MTDQDLFFQNNNDLNSISSICKDSIGISRLIYGSGLPSKFFKNNKSEFNWTFDHSIQYSPKKLSLFIVQDY